MLSSKNLSARQKILARILLPTLFLVVASNLATLVMTYSALDSELNSKDKKLLIRDAEQSSFYLGRTIAALSVDSAQVAKFPAVKEFITHEMSDPGGTQSKEWLVRMEDLFTGVIETRSRYIQIRLIDLSGMEIARIDRDGPQGAARRVNKADLQNKASRDYVTKGATLKRGELYFSQIDLNIEHAKIQLPRQLVVRAITPLFEETSGRRYGMLVINMALNEALAQLPRLIDPNRKIMVVDHQGQYLYHPQSDHAITSSTGHHFNAFEEYPEMRQLAPNLSVQLGNSDSYSLAIQRLSFGAEFDSYVVIRSDKSDVVDLRYQVLSRTSILLLLVLVIAILVTTLLARRLTLPISLMAEHILARKDGRSQLTDAIPNYTVSELKQLAQAFDTANERIVAGQMELEQKLVLLDKKNLELQQLTYIASHDLQEPLRTIRSFINIISKRYADQLDEKGLEMMGFIEESSSRMQELVKDLLDYGRIGKNLSPGPVDLNKLIHNVEQDMADSFTQTDAKLILSELPQVIGLETELRLLFQNLLSNAIKFARKGVSPVICVSAEPIERGWQISVCDNGIGIDPKYRDKVFGVFKRLHSKQEYPGTGIGLAHCKKIVELHGGQIWIEELASPGSCFVFTIKEVVNENHRHNTAG